MAEKVYTIIWITDDADGVIMQEKFTKIGKALDRYAELANHTNVEHVLFVDGFLLTETYSDQTATSGNPKGGEDRVSQSSSLHSGV